MVFSKTLFWSLAIAGMALLAATAIYCLARISPPELLTPFQSTIPILAGQAGLFGSAPSFFYTFAIGLLVGTCAPTPASAKAHCLIWVSLALLLEISQHPIVAEPLIARLEDTLFISAWRVIGPYWIRGVFDPMDMIVTVTGGLAALVMLIYIAKDKC